MQTKESTKIKSLSPETHSKKAHLLIDKGQTKFKDHEADREYEDSLQQPAWHVVVLSIFTMGLYMPFWFYQTGSKLEKTAQQLLNGDSEVAATQEHEAASLRLAKAGTLESFKGMSNLNLLVFTFLFMLPIVNLVVLQRFACRYAGLIPNKESLVRKNQAFSGFLIAGVFGLSALLGKLPGNWYLFYLSACLPLAVVQFWLNQHWSLYENEENLPRQAFSPLELLMIIAGALLLGLILIGAEINK
jgi:hypothetical protein